jgi:hypothetical protein
LFLVFAVPLDGLAAVRAGHTEGINTINTIDRYLLDEDECTFAVLAITLRVPITTFKHALCDVHTLWK